MKDDIRKILNKCPQCNDTEITDVEHCHDCSGWDTGHCDCGGSPVQCNCQEAKIGAIHDLLAKMLKEMIGEQKYEGGYLETMSFNIENRGYNIHRKEMLDKLDKL